MEIRFLSSEKTECMPEQLATVRLILLYSRGFEKREKNTAPNSLIGGIGAVKLGYASLAAL